MGVVKNFILAARPKTLLAGVIPPIVAYFFFLTSFQDLEGLHYFIFCVLGALFIQLATNFFNDVIDFKKGADQKRLGPVRVSSAGLVPIQTVQRWAYGCLVLAFLCGIPIIIRGGLPFIFLGLISLYLTYGYTGGKASLAYRGLGEIFVFLFFGLFSFMGSYYLYSLELNIKVFLLAVIYGLLNTTFIAINNLRDRETDQLVGKMTLATRLSVRAYKAFIIMTIFSPYLILHAFRDLKHIYFIFIALLPALKLGHIALYKEKQELNEGLKYSGVHLLLFSLLLCVIFQFQR